MNEFDQIDLSFEKDSFLKSRLSCFKRRAAELANFIERYKVKPSPIHVSRYDENNPKISGDLPDELILEGLYRRFRFFYLEKEDSNYYSMLKSISKSTNSELLHSFCRIERRRFLKDELIDWAFCEATKKYEPNEIIDFWFNSFYFHDRDYEAEILNNFKISVSEKGAKIALFYIVYMASHQIMYLNHLLRDTTEEEQKMYLQVFSEYF